LRADAEQLLIDQRHLGAVPILERQLVAEAEDLAVDVEGVLSLGGPDREVVTPRQNPLPQDVSHGRVPAAGYLCDDGGTRPLSRM
jgi:hypothetical protein